MAEIIRMPLLSDTMTEGKIAAWNKKVGDFVKSDDAIADVETDKATMEVVPYVEGTLLYIGVEVGKAAKVNEIIAILGKEGEDISSLIEEKQAPQENEIKKVVENNNDTKMSTLPKELTVITMPLLSDTMKEGKIVVWNKQVGDKVKADDALADVETDKATMEVIGYADGTLLYTGIKAGEAAKVNDVIAVVGPDGFDIEPYIALLKTTHVDAIPEAKPEPVANKESNIQSQHTETHHISNDGRIKASPLAKQIAKEKGIDLSNIQGSGDAGRIIKRDLDSQTPLAIKKATTTSIPTFVDGHEGFVDTEVSQMRKIIASRLGESKFSAPHFYLKISVEMDNLLTNRKAINAQSDVKISINDMLIKACALALQKHPGVNSSWMGDFIRQYEHVHIGSAIALPDGLIVPVIKFANQKSLAQIATQANELYEKARNKKIQPAEFTGNTFTISNLGMMDIDEFTAIINPPDACILAVGKTSETPVVRNGKIVVRNIMKLTLSCDHRVVDGAVGAAFLQTLKSYIENPILMLL
ncbi:MAG: 2-oxo acid dehydrogenase subunit E2 [Chitinophagaceae bacterium]